MPPKTPAPRTTTSLETQAPDMEGSPEPLEQRLYDLLSPFLEVAQEHGSNQVPLAEQSKAMVLCENLAFLIRHNQASYGKLIGVGDILVATKNWDLRTKGADGVICVGVYINGNHNYTYCLVRVVMRSLDKIIDKLAECVEPLLAPFCPGL
ncbi:hypothetical protein B5807_10657 [Epicoccum nigrum]|uniref:Uncharacterized protein n=1 Tax=Epicoccum nigrum TaxID=105696 RepID=A0A1Y2LL49_EPING|nr:hypothetical protein B5807_10657 [Epicoccum nigrum]